MAEPFIGEVKMFGFDWAPDKWAKCDGGQIQINQNPTLYAVLGSAYGGNDTTFFNLPDLRGRTPVHTGTLGNIVAIDRGTKGGQETVVLTANTVPSHTHRVNVSSSTANGRDPTGKVLAAPQDRNIYGDAVNLVAMNSLAITTAGAPSVQSHNNMQPYTVINFCIALDGAFPPRN